MLRLAADSKSTRVDAIPGAKVGHIANHLNNDTAIFAQADIVAIHAGANMDLGSVEASKPQLAAQTQELVDVIKPLVEAEKSVFVVDPIAGALVKEAPGGHHWAMVRQRMKKVAKETKSHWISLQNVNWVAKEDIAEDGIHYSKSGTKKVMEKVGETVKQVTGVDVIAGMEFQDKPYEAIYRNHYKFGCYRCTRVHERGPCPPLPEEDLDNSDNSSNESSNINSSSDNNNSTIRTAGNAHNISVDSWAEPEDDEAPAVAPTAGAVSTPVPASASGPADASRLRSASTSCGPAAAASASAAIAAYDALTTT